MHLDLLPDCDTLVDQELVDVTPLVTLKLDDGAPLFVVHDGSVAAPRLFELTQNFLEIEVLREALNEREALASRTLLELEI